MLTGNVPEVGYGTTGQKMNSDLILYQSEDGAIHVNVRLEEETIWLTQAAMAEIFDCTIENIIQHLANSLRFRGIADGGNC